MKILVTMAGRGSRFRRVGISKPKHEITVRGKPMFDWAMRSLKLFFDESFIFVTQKEHSSVEFLESACARLGIKDYDTVTLDKYTDGQASTAIKADPLIDSKEAVAIYNIDTYIEPGYLSKDILRGSGTVPTFVAEGERWSFAKTDRSDRIIRLSEKEKISNHATAGFYYFDMWGEFKNAYCTYSDDVRHDYGETYIAPHYNYLVDIGRDIFKHDIDRSAVHVLGTPNDLQTFDNRFDPESQ